MNINKRGLTGRVKETIIVLSEAAGENSSFGLHLRIYKVMYLSMQTV